MALEVMDDFMTSNLNANPEVRDKCRMNYRHFFELCHFLDQDGQFINSGWQRWVSPALFLTWDRLLLDKVIRPPLTNPMLLDAIRRHEIHKLLGASSIELAEITPGVSQLYLEVGANNRFVSLATTPKVTALGDARSIDAAEWLVEAETDAAVGRAIRTVSLLKRNSRMATAIKHLYGHTCTVCGVRLQTGNDPEIYYSELAHIKPLGKPHDGPDMAGNMIVLCPNHHKQFDAGIIGIKRESDTYVVISQIPGDVLHLRAIELRGRHRLDDGCIDWHRQWNGLDAPAGAIIVKPTPES